MCEASDLHRTPHSLPAQAIDQFGEHLFEGYAVKGVAGLGHRVWGGRKADWRWHCIWPSRSEHDRHITIVKPEPPITLAVMALGLTHALRTNRYGR